MKLPQINPVNYYLPKNEKGHRRPRLLGTAAALLLVAGAVVEFNWAEDRGHDQARSSCVDAIASGKIKVLDRITLPRENVEDISTFVSSPLVSDSHAAPEELKDMGYTKLKDAVTSPSTHIVEFEVPYDQTQQLPNWKALVGDAGELGVLIDKRMTGEDHPIITGTVTPVPAAEAYPQAPLQVVVGTPDC